jgi:hypothetical protein
VVLSKELDIEPYAHFLSIQVNQTIKPITNKETKKGIILTVFFTNMVIHLPILL